MTSQKITSIHIRDSGVRMRNNIAFYVYINPYVFQRFQKSQNCNLRYCNLRYQNNPIMKSDYLLKFRVVSLFFRSQFHTDVSNLISECQSIQITCGIKGVSSISEEKSLKLFFLLYAWTEYIRDAIRQTFLKLSLRSFLLKIPALYCPSCNTLTVSLH